MSYSPKYLKIVELLQRQFSSGRFAPGDVLPGEIALAQKLGCSRRTLRNALQILEDDGFILRKKGVGAMLTPADMHRRRRHSDVAVVYLAPPDAEHNYDFLLRRTLLAEGIIRSVAGKGHWLRIVPLAEQNRQATAEELFRKGIDGFIFPEIANGVLGILRETVRRKVPHVVLESALDLPGVNLITADDYQAGYDMISMLLREGSGELAFIGGLFKSEFRNSANRRRFRGAEQAMIDHHAAIDRRFFQAWEDQRDETPVELERGKIAAIARKMLDHKDMPHTVVLSSLLAADVFVAEVKARRHDDLSRYRMLTFRGSCNWREVQNLREVLAMEYFSCDQSTGVRRGIEMLDRWLNDPAYRPDRVFVSSGYHKGGEVAVWGDEPAQGILLDGQAI